MPGLYHGWDHEDDNHADFRHGGVEESDFDDIIKYKKKNKNYRKKVKSGCPENDFKQHVWIWVPWYDDCPDYEVRVCCGCEKRYSGMRGFRRKP